MLSLFRLSRRSGWILQGGGHGRKEHQKETLFGNVEQEHHPPQVNEEPLTEQEQRFSLFLENLPLAVSIKDESGYFLFANEFMQNLLGASNPIGKFVEELLPAEIASAITDNDHKALAQGLLLVQDTVRDSYGDDRIFETYKFPMSTPGGKTLLGSISVDITERKRAEQSLAQKQEQLEELNRSLELRVKHCG